MAKNTITLKVYDKDKKTVKKELSATPQDLMFGSVRALMKLLKIEDINDTSELLHVVYDAWEELVAILEDFFPEAEDEDWDNVKLNELIPVIVSILGISFAGVLNLPKDKSSKN